MSESGVGNYFVENIIHVYLLINMHVCQSSYYLPLEPDFNLIAVRRDESPNGVRFKDQKHVWSRDLGLLLASLQFEKGNISSNTAFSFIVRATFCYIH